MFVVLTLFLICTLLVALVTLAVIFISVAFGNTRQFVEKQNRSDVMDLLDTVSDVRTDPTNPASPTIADLVEAGVFDDWIHGEKIAS